MTMTIGRPEPSGLAHQRPNISGIISATASASQPLRRPSWSIEAPRNGAVAMVAQPEYWLHCEITSWPAVGLDCGQPTITEAT